MRLALIPHPDTPCTAVSRIEVDVERPAPRRLELTCRVIGVIGDLRLPPPSPSVRADELWRHTCFEAFVRSPDDAGYREFNLSPSTRWAAYRFTGYRSGMSILNGIAPPRIEVSSDETSVELRAWLDPAALADLPADGPWRLGLSAVIEDAAGGISYWALAHPPGKADFHHADCIAAQLMAPQQP